MATLEKVQAQIAKLQAQAESLVAKQSSGVIAKIRDMMEQHGLTIVDIDAHLGAPKPRGPGESKTAASSASVAKYRDPKSGATWTGRGRAPAWIANVKDRSRYLIEAQPVISNSGVKKESKAGNYVRGPQAPKYRDLKTGATWSGRGPAPAWLASVKDRTKFLITGATAGAADAMSPAAKKLPAPNTKPVARKSGAKTSPSKTER